MTQALVDFVVELTHSGDEREGMKEVKWIFSVDGASNVKENEARVILEGPDGVLVEQFAFNASNNQTEYEALLAGMRLARDMGVKSLLVRCDLQLVTEQVGENFQAKYHILKTIWERCV